MSITFGGLASGLDTNSIVTQLLALERRPIDLLQKRISQVQQTTNLYSSLKGDVSKLQTALKGLTAKSFLDTDPFTAKSVSTSDDKTATATITDPALAAEQNINVRVTRLASATAATSSLVIGRGVTTPTLLKDIPGASFNSGTFTVNGNGRNYAITVDKDTSTVNSVLTQLRALSGVVASATVNSNGQFVITGATGANLRLGASGDTSNFLQQTYLDTATRNASEVITSTGFVTQLNLTTTNLANAGLRTAVAAGSTFRINGASFTTDGKSLTDILADINASSEAGVTASYNATTGRVRIVNKNLGPSLINFSNTTGNFLTALAITTPTNVTSTQVQGVTSQATVNGQNVLGAGNTLDSSVTGLAGVSIDLKALSATGTSVNLGVTKDNTTLKTKVNDFITQFNTIVSRIDVLTDAKTGQIGTDNRLTGFRNQLRNILASGVTGAGPYTSLAQVGIGTGAAGTSGGIAPKTLLLDSAKLDKALLEDPANLKNLLTGPNGAFTKLQAFVDGALALGDGSQAANQGLFQAQNSGSQTTIKRLNESIAKANDRLARREKLLRRQFQVSESLISQFQAQGQAVSGLAASLGAANK